MVPCGIRHPHPCGTRHPHLCGTGHLHPCGIRHPQPCGTGHRHPCGIRHPQPCGTGHRHLTQPLSHAIARQLPSWGSFHHLARQPSCPSAMPAIQMIMIRIGSIKRSTAFIAFHIFVITIQSILRYMIVLGYTARPIAPRTSR